MLTDSGGDRLVHDLTFIDRSANFKSSTLSNHIATDGHKQAEKESLHVIWYATSAGSLTHPGKVIHEVRMYSVIGSGFRKMTEKEREVLVKFYDTAHYITVKGNAFTDFEDFTK